MKCQHPWCESRKAKRYTMRVVVDRSVGTMRGFEIRLCSHHAHKRAENGTDIKPLKQEGER